MASEREMQDEHTRSILLLGRLIKAAHPYTYGHHQRVALWSSKVAQRIGLGDSSLREIGEAALLHDIGKIGIDDRLLNKIGRLNEGEWNTIKTHPELGADIIRQMSSLGHIANWVKHHHERVDGLGYPCGLKGSSIPIESRIISVVDAFDAMTGGESPESGRVYRRTISPEEACDEICRCAGTQFDRDIARVFIEVLIDEEVLPANHGGARRLRNMAA
jgi:putative nucleotidyltransferase with HDIG domain